MYHACVKVGGQLVRAGFQFSPFYHIDLRGQTQVTELGSKSLFPLSHFVLMLGVLWPPHSEDSNLGVERKDLSEDGFCPNLDLFSPLSFLWVRICKCADQVH